MCRSCGASRSGSRSGAIHIDTVTLSLVLGILLLGLVMVTSASIYMASNQGGEAFVYLQRQLLLTFMGAIGAAFMFCIPTRMLDRISTPLLIVAVLLLLVVLVPGLGHAVNGSRRWLRIAGFNFQLNRFTEFMDHFSNQVDLSKSIGAFLAVAHVKLKEDPAPTVANF